MPRTAFIVLLAAAAGSLIPASADTIVYRGREYSGVTIEELSNQYVVHFPDTGRKKYFRKEEVTSVQRTGNSGQAGSPERPGVYSASKPAVRPQEPETADLTPQQIALQEYKQRKRIRAQAEFEAALEHWSKLTDEQREALLASAVDQAAAAEAERQQTAQAIADQRQQFDGEREARRVSAESTAVERDRTINETYAAAFEVQDVDPFGYLTDREAQHTVALADSVGLAPEEFLEEYLDGFAYPPVPYFETGRRRLADALDDADVEAYWIEQEYNARIAEESRALSQLEGEARRFDRRSKTVLRSNADRARRLASTADYLAVLEDARAAEYEPSLKYRSLFSVEGKGVTQRHISAAAPILRIDWWLDISSPLANQLTIRVYDSVSEKPVKADSSAKLPSDHFLIIDEPGDYLVEAEGPEGLTYTIEAKELQDLTLPPPAEEE